MEGRRLAVIGAGVSRTWPSLSNGRLARVVMVGVCMAILGGTRVADASQRPRQPARQPQAAPPASKYTGLGKWWRNTKYKMKSAWNAPKMLSEVYTTPPKPLQVFEYGPSRRTFLLHPEKYEYQYVCVMSRSGKISEGTWHRRKTPTNWIRNPPYHVRIVRPTPAGLLHYMMTTGKAKLEKTEITITATDDETGETNDVTRTMTVIRRTDKDLPRKNAVIQWWKSHKPGFLPREPETAGRWGPPIDPEEPEGFEAELKEFMYDALEAESGDEPEE